MEDFLISDEIVFDAKPMAVPYNYRISYKISQLLLIISMCCSKGGCSLVKLNMISMAMCNKKEKQPLMDFAKGKIVEIPIVRFDPAVNRATLYAISDKLIIQQKNGKFKLDIKGKTFVSKIMQDENLMVNEKTFLSQLSTSLTEEIIENIIANWR